MSFFCTERLVIDRHNDSGNLKTMVGWLNDPEIMRYSEQRHVKHTIASQAGYIWDFERPSMFREVRCGGKLLGTMTAHVDKYNDVADVGILIGDKSMWGKGFGYEAWEGLCDHLLLNGIRKIEAGAMSENRAMVAIFHRYGMQYEGRRFEHFRLGSKQACDLVQWGKFGG